MTQNAMSKKNTVRWLTVSAIGTMAWSGAVWGQIDPGVQINTDNNNDNIVGDAANEPSFVVNPLDPNNMVAGWRQFPTINSNFRLAGVAFTIDGGVTWTNLGVLDEPPGTNNPNQTDPVLAADLDGNLFYNSMLFGSADGQVVYKSTDGGASWEDADFIYADGTDKNWYAVDQRSSGQGASNHYATWQFGGGRFARSTDGGQTWDTWVNGASIYAYLETDTQGTVHTGWWTGGGISYRKSTNAKDGSQTPTFTPTKFIPFGDLPWQLPINPAGAAGMITIDTPQEGEPNDGAVYMMASSVTNSDVCDVMFAKSLDRGQTWSTPIRVNDDSDTNDFNWMSAMSLAPGGRIDAVWLDTRDDPAHFLSKLYYSCSYDGGDTWIPNRALTAAFDTSLGWPNQNKMGDYFQNQSSNSLTNIVYAATFNGEQDVYFLRHHPINLTVGPMNGGQNTVFAITDAKPNSKAYLTYSMAGAGATNVAALDVTLGIKNPKLAGSARTTDGSGATAWNLPVPNSATGKQVWMQVAQLANTSQVVTQTVQ